MSLFSRLAKGNEKQFYPWSQKKLAGGSSMLPRFGHATTVHPGADSLIVYGGTHRGAIGKKDLFFIESQTTLSADSINAAGDVPRPRNNPVLITVEGGLLVYGGEPLLREEKWDASFYFFKLRDRRWIQLVVGGEPATERTGHTATVHGDHVYIYGGHHYTTFYPHILTFHIKNHRLETIPSINTPPPPRTDHASVLYDNKLFIFGGSDPDGKLYNDVWSFDIRTREWQSFPAQGFIPSPRCRVAFDIVDDTLYIFGGKDEFGRELGDLYSLKITTQRWYIFQKMGPSPPPRFGATMTTIQNKVYIVGGETSRGKPEDTPLVYVLDTSRITYQPPPNANTNDAPSVMSTFSSPEIDVSTSTPQQTSISSSFHQPNQNQPHTVTSSYRGSPTSPTEASMSMSDLSYPVAVQNSDQMSATTRPPRPPRHLEPSQSTSSSRHGAASSEPSRTPSMDQNVTRPARPSRDGAYLGLPRDEPSHYQPNLQQAPDLTKPSTQAPGMSASNGPLPSLPAAGTALPPTSRPLQPNPSDTDPPPPEDRAALVREIRNRDATIVEMKKKETWWRTEVSLARKQRNKTPVDSKADEEAGLYDLQRNPEAAKLFEQLVAVRRELRHVRNDINQQAQPVSDKMYQSDRMRNAALQEAAYFKSKYYALKECRRDDLSATEADRTENLEHRLAEALRENEENYRMLQQLQKRAQHDEAARESAEERAQEALGRADEIQAKYQRTLDDLALLRARACKAESLVQDSAAMIAELNRQLTEALQAETRTEETAAAKSRISELEVAHLKSRNENAVLKQKLAERDDSIARLRVQLSEREAALSELTRRLEDTEIQLAMLKGAMAQQSLAATARV